MVQNGRLLTSVLTSLPVVLMVILLALRNEIGKYRHSLHEIGRIKQETMSMDRCCKSLDSDRT